MKKIKKYKDNSYYDYYINSKSDFVNKSKNNVEVVKAVSLPAGIVEDIDLYIEARQVAV